MNKSSDWSQALVLTVPVMMGYVPLGMAFAVLWVQNDLPWQYALLASVVLYAGAMQFLLAGLLAAGAGLAEIAIATVAVNMRHIFYGLSYPRTAFAKQDKRLLYGIFALTDEAYSLVANLGEETSATLIVRIQLLCQLYWLLGTVLGLLVGMIIPATWVGFDFALAALFIVLTQHHFYHRQRRVAMMMGLVAIAFSLLAFSQQQLSIAIVVLLGLLYFHPREANKDTP